jgi:hypothetical protein
MQIISYEKLKYIYFSINDLFNVIIEVEPQQLDDLDELKYLQTKDAKGMCDILLNCENNQITIVKESLGLFLKRLSTR